MLIEVSVLKNYPSSNLNRDNTGAPKVCELGGITRGRISSQCLKKNMRDGDIFKSILKENSVSIRTRHLYDLIWGNLKKEGISEEYYIPVVKLLHTLGKKESASKLEELKEVKELPTELTKKEIAGTGQIISYSNEDIKVITESLLQLIKETETVKKFASVKNGDLVKIMKQSINRPITLDIALFGRMVSTSGMSNIEASMQVAHAVSTHKVVSESDYFTAVDDLAGMTGETGSAMLSDTEFNACCYYEYLNIDTDKLAENLSLNNLDENEIKDIVTLVIKSFIYTNPTGKQNSFAAHVLPEVVLVEFKDTKVPVNYSNAFVEGVTKYDEKGILRGSIQKLVDEINRVDEYYGVDLKERLWLDTRNVANPDNSLVCKSLNILLDKMSEIVRQ